jgi:protein tyrosine phosphatase
MYQITPYFKEVFDFIDSAFMDDETSSYTEDMKQLKISEENNGNNNYNGHGVEFNSGDINNYTFKKYGDNSTNESSYEKLPSESVILNLQDQIDNLDCLDRRDTLIQKELRKSISKKNNNRVLIHCSLGVSRSGSFTILYLMKKFSLNYETVSKFY